MTSEMNVLLEKLQEAIDEAIAESGRINEIVAEMKRSGYDLCLILESSVAVSPVVSTNEDAVPMDDVPESRPVSNVSAFSGEIKLTADDLEFLEELNISL